MATGLMIYDFSCVFFFNSVSFDFIYNFLFLFCIPDLIVLIVFF